MPQPTGPIAASDGTLRRWPLRRGYLLAVLVLVGALLLVFLYARSARERDARIADAEHVAQAERIATQLQERLLRYELAIRGGVSLFASVSRPTERQWQGYVDGLNLRRQFPGLMGLGYAPYLRSDGLQQLQLEIRDAGAGLFVVQPVGVRDAYGPILYLEPKTLDNRAAIGFDMFSEARRAAAMSAARDTAQVRLTAPVNLLQQRDRPGATGLLMYAPVYAGGYAPPSAAARRASFSGWVYAPFAVDAFIAGAAGTQAPAYSLRILDVDEGGAVVHRDAAFTDTPDASVWQHAVEHEAYGRHWRIEFQTSAPAQGGVASELDATLLAGLLASLLLFSVVATLAHTQTRAERIAARMSESYRRSELRFRSAMQYSAAGTALLDGDGRIVEANDALARLFARPPGDLVGARLATMFDDPAELFAHERERTLRDGSAHRITRHYVRNGGDMRHLQLVFSPVPGEIGSDVAWLVQIEDVTDRLRAEERVRAMNRLLETRVEQRTRELMQANRELESFAYSVSHDLRAPLRSVEGFARILNERHAAAMDDNGKGYLARIRNAALRMDALIDALLRLSRITREELHPARMDISQVAGDVVAELQQAEPDRQVDVRIEPGLVAAGDPPLVRDLLQNLIGNAWKFTRDVDAPRIELSAAPLRPGEDDLHAFLVHDNGAGFEPGYAAKLFRPFQRLHDAERFAGHGIGLATVKRIVERHGGSIEADGTPGQGARFRFTLPANTANTANTADVGDTQH